MSKRPYKKKQKIVTNASFDYKECVAWALIENDVPDRIAEIAVIDFRYEVNVGFHNKNTPRETAFSMLKKVKKTYMNEDQTWHYGYRPRSIMANAVVSKTSDVGSIPTEGANG